MKEKQEIIELTKAVVQNIEDLDNWVDTHLEEIKDYTDTVSDIVGPIKSILSVVKLVKARKFKSFLNSYGSEIKKNNGQVEEKFASQLKEYLKSRSNLEMLYASIDSAVQANSVYSSSCIGYLSGKKLSKLSDSNNTTFLLINAFKSLNDYELYSSARILDSVIDWTQTQYLNKLDVISLKTISGYTVVKLKNLQVIDYPNHEKYILGGKNEQEVFDLSEVTEEFWGILKDSGVYAQMKKDYT